MVDKRVMRLFTLLIITLIVLITGHIMVVVILAPFIFNTWLIRKSKFSFST